MLDAMKGGLFTRKIVQWFHGYISVFKWCIPFSWKTSPKYTVIRIMGSLFLPFLSIVDTILGKELINSLTRVMGPTTLAMSRIGILMFVMLCVTLLQKGIQSLLQYCQSTHNELNNHAVTQILMEKSLTADMKLYTDPKYIDKIDSVNQDIGAVSEVLWNIISAISAFVNLICVLIIMLRYDSLIPLIVIFAAIPSSLISLKCTQIAYNLNIEQVSDRRKMNYSQIISCDKTYAEQIRQLNISKWIQTRYNRIWNALFSKRVRTNRKIIIITLAFDCLPEIAIIFITMNIATQILNGQATIGDYTLYTGLLEQLWSAVFLILSTSVMIFSNKLKIDNIQSLLKINNQILTNGSEALTYIETISFDHVSFTYPGTDREVITDLTFDLKRPDRVAFIGINGSGKSTLIKLLIRLYDPDKGVIYINGIDIRKYRLSDLRSNFSVYFQNMTNYAFSLRDNFVVSDIYKEASNKNIDIALQGVCFKELLDFSSEGYGMNITRLFDSDGVELSTGQYQKLALARVVFRECSAFIFDEPFSSLDPKSEQEIFASLETFAKEKLTIFITHDLSNISFADRIILLEDGRLIADGSHSELISKSNRYAELLQYKDSKL